MRNSAIATAASTPPGLVSASAVGLRSVAAVLHWSAISVETPIIVLVRSLTSALFDSPPNADRTTHRPRLDAAVAEQQPCGQEARGPRRPLLRPRTMPVSFMAAALADVGAERSRVAVCAGTDPRSCGKRSAIRFDTRQKGARKPLGHKGKVRERVLHDETA